MKIAHLAEFGPRLCGLYHTAKELVLAERTVGVDARLVAFSDKYDGIQKDGSFTTEDIKWAYSADILVRHSAIPAHLQNAGIPVVMALHGRPESSFRLEQKKIVPVISSLYGKVKDCRYKAFITFWPEYVDIWSSIVPKEKLFYIPAPVDLKEYCPDNKPYDWEEYKGDYNILIPDIWREDVIPFNVLFAAVKFAKKHKGTRIHLVGVPSDCIKAIKPFCVSLRNSGVLGVIAGQMRDIKGFYAASDLVVTPHNIATRVIRESLASNTPVVAGSGCRYTPYTANPMDIDNFAKAIEKCYNNQEAYEPRKIAEAEFNLKRSGVAASRIFRKLLHQKKKGGKRKVFIDIGSHLGESVRRFYREVNDAGDYEIYCFEPDIETFTKLDENISHIKNVQLINACVGKNDGIVDFFIGQTNDNEGGTLAEGKLTGRIQYDSPVKVESIDFCRWLKANVRKEDYVVLKMNIEGGEYEIMKLLLDNNLTSLIDKAFIQLHAHKFSHGEQRQEFQKIEARFWNEAKCQKYLTNKGFYPFE